MEENKMTDKERIIQVITDQIALCGPDPEKDRWWVTFTADDAKMIRDMLQNEYWRGYRRGRSDEAGLRDGTIMQTFSPD